jgi:phosphoserine aminotransferase
LPRDPELAFSAEPEYLHYISNETVEGLQFHRLIGPEGVTRICDMSSDFLSRPINASRFGLIYAHAQKNLGPAGVTVVLLREDLLERIPENLPAMLDFRNHVNMGSIYNTPPVFAIYVTLLITRWLLQDVGGLQAMDCLNRAKAEKIYETIDASGGFYAGRAAEPDRSLMNATFQLPTAELTAKFIAQADAEGFAGLAGHRRLGGVRASLYNAVTLEAVQALCGFMDYFRERQGH